ncbi:hypothetical protein TBLA_0I02450 [Henningerozyma blattae CBS 6284]|uniref:Uncharacterized protein n=1 Tax=Henningerozyma blattae (strain ATCC 34711 / CBS 6284 / DSM 70876 / NBRC 10599 / NRRL Y-10934 / UCD 77-7) TaxID=1071380 RepID=I2H951_HENB6|nr:hypothetical protein TBLA_0I02450 [Tetrapisispora blattae CBS 6284]CCH62903.1 hypothetical protein TBLA_0I02450 [Tetrapisispora blattae CBS 6284]
MLLFSVLGTILALICSGTMINRYFSFKKHRHTEPLVLSVLLVNMLLLLSTAWLFPSDIFSTAVKNKSDGDEFTNSTTTLMTISNEKSSLVKRMIQNNITSGNSIEQLTNILTNLDINDAIIDESSSFRSEWLFIYWLEFIICWLIIPLLISYVGLKYSVPETFRRQRFSKALMHNIKFYSLCFIGLLAGLFYLLLSSNHSVTIKTIKPLLISLSHLYSLSFTLILLSTGIVLLPKDLIAQVRDSTHQSNNKLFVALSKTNEDLNDAQLNMIDFAREILNTPDSQIGDISFNHTLQLCKFEIQNLLRTLKNLPSQSIPTISNSIEISTITTFDKLNNKFNKFLNEYYNFLYAEAYSDSIIHQLAKSESTPNIFIKFMKFFVGLLSTILSILLFFLELFPTRWAHGWIFNGTAWFNFFFELIILSYAILTSLYAMSKFKFNNLHLIPNGQSNPINALYYSLYSSRLLFPLCFNLMTMIPNSTSNIKSSFETTLYEDLTFIPLVNFLNKYLPIVFMIIIPLSYKYDLKSKLLIKILGEEYYYLFFGMMLYEPVSEIRGNEEMESGMGLFSSSTNSRGINNDNTNVNNSSRSRINQDYEYSLQDGRYLFERASTHYSLLDNEANSTANTFLNDSSFLDDSNNNNNLI